MAESLKFIQEIGVDRIHNHKVQLLELLESNLKRIQGLDLLVKSTNSRVAVSSFVVPGVSSFRYCRTFGSRGLRCKSWPSLCSNTNGSTWY